MQNLQRISERNFILGYNDKDKPEDLRKPDGSVYMADIRNAFIEENKIMKRTGYSAIGDAPVSKAILGQNKHEPSGGTKYILRARNNAGDTQSVIEGWSGSGNWTALTSGSSQTTSLNHEFVMAENATYIFNGTDTVGKTTNGTSMSTVAAIPIGLGAKWWHNFLFVFGVTGNRSRLYFSDVNEPETFDGVNGLVDINTDDNENIEALAALKDILVILKRSSVFLLTGFGTTDFTLANLDDFGTGIGTIAPRSVVETGNDVYFLTYYGDVPHFKSIRRTTEDALVDGGIISDAITGSMKRMVVGRLNQTAGIFDGRRVWWSVCTSGTTNNEVFVYDTLTGGWVRLTGINANIFHNSTISGSPAIYFGSSTANGKSYQMDGTTNDDGAAISFLVDTPMYNPQPGYPSRYKYLYLTADVGSEVDLDIDFSPDGFTFGDRATMSFTGEGAEFGTAIFDTSKFGATTLARNRIFAGGTANYMQYRFTNAVVDEEITIREFEIFWGKRSLRA